MVGRLHRRKVALRRAIALAYDSEQEIRLVRKAQAVPAQTAVAPLAFGWNPALKTSSMSGHAWRAPRAARHLRLCRPRRRRLARSPDGSALVLEYATQPDQGRQPPSCAVENMTAVTKIEFKVAKVAGEPEGLARRQADDVGRGLVGHHAGRRYLPRARLRPQQGRRQPLARLR